MRVGTPFYKNPLAINREMVQDRWGIYPYVANNTAKFTTQRGVRILCPHPLLMNLMRTNDRMVWYKRLPCNVFCDTLISRTALKRKNKYAEVFTTHFVWAQFYPMKTKGGSHEALLLISQRTGVLDHLIVDGSKEQVLGSFKRKCSEAGYCLKQMKPYSPRQNATEGTIREPKRRSVRNITKSCSANKLWVTSWNWKDLFALTLTLIHSSLRGRYQKP